MLKDYARIRYLLLYNFNKKRQRTRTVNLVTNLYYNTFKEPFIHGSFKGIFVFWTELLYILCELARSRVFLAASSE